ncbi:MAG: chorismate synthase [Selenomonadales bacterium]|jgi:chorismate synthase|nr:chorismate synthase [Selenomonadales bacterium]MBQ2246246.1 chorismate synthase [Selenomonadales bacterium]MBR0326016.1 chorismate synthase [Selenomonadales bacterium]
MFRFLTTGESHGQCLTAIIEGLPAGLKVNVDKINEELAKRQQGYGRGGRMKIETDRVDIVSGVRFGETMGDPITLRIQNKDWENWTDRMSVSGMPAGAPVTAARPGHADLSGILKYDRTDIRDILERASARETAARVAVGALCKQFLESCGISLVAHVTNIGGVAMTDADIQDWDHYRASEMRCTNEAVEARMKQAIDEAKQAGDTLGGVFEVIVRGSMVGLGSHTQWDRKLDAKIAAAMMSIQAIKGVEIGVGFEYGNLPGSQAHDELFYEEGRGYYRTSNRAGGLEGGMTNGEDIIVKAVMKPIPTLMQPLSSVDVHTHEAVKACRERSDVCAVSAASVVGEAMMAIVMTEAVLEKFGGDCMVDFLAAVRHYKDRIKQA